MNLFRIHPYFSSLIVSAQKNSRLANLFIWNEIKLTVIKCDYEQSIFELIKCQCNYLFNFNYLPSYLLTKNSSSCNTFLILGDFGRGVFLSFVLIILFPCILLSREFL